MTLLRSPALLGANSLPASYTPMAQSARLKPATVLIAEHEALMRLELAEWLTEQGFVVLEARNADGAIALLDTHPEIELLITDIRMPGSMDGVRLAHHVRGRWPPVTIIVVSGLFETQLSDLPEGSIFLSKPFERQKLLRALAPFTDGSQPSPLGRHAA